MYLLTELDSLSALKDNWDTYGAEAPSAEAVNAAKNLIAALGKKDPKPYRVGPSARGGVAVTFANGTRSYMFEFFNDGDISSVWSDGRGNIDAEELVEGQPWDSVLLKVGAFLGLDPEG